MDQLLPAISQKHLSRTGGFCPKSAEMSTLLACQPVWSPMVVCCHVCDLLIAVLLPTGSMNELRGVAEENLKQHVGIGCK